jgi:DNA (cytosine-5)-methyltransferase 1
MRSVELFAGCGGLALGLARAGFRHESVIELDPHAVSILVENKRRRVEHIRDWSITQQDVRRVDFSHLVGPVDLVAGGPPCQPFSIGGKHGGPEDGRNMWLEAIRAVRELRPKAFLFENVRGLLRPAFADYLSYLKLYLSSPEVSANPGESWSAHHARLERHQSARRGQLTYGVVFGAINTADYGAPQQRHRVIALGVRRDVAENWEFPSATHSRDALLWSKYVSGEYWLRHSSGTEPLGGSDRDVPLLTKLLDKGVEPATRPWLTVRDALADLPPPTESTEDVPNHRLRLGAKAYPRHTGSRWDMPAKALKAGDHGVPGGENMLALTDGTVRYFTLREMARLHGFPDTFVVPNTWKRPIRQLGNAVPVQVGEAFGKCVAAIIARSEQAPRLRVA